MYDNINARDAKRILHGLHNILRCVRPQDLPTVAKHLAVHHHIPQKVMLTVMARYARIHHTN
jgi:pyrroline-5-carboxylate reductase